jgi:hypothetical protein
MMNVMGAPVPSGYNINATFYTRNKILFNVTVQNGYEVEIAYTNALTNRDFVKFTTNGTSGGGVITDWWTDSQWFNTTMDKDNSYTTQTIKSTKSGTTFTAFRTVSGLGGQDSAFKCNSANRLFWIIRNTDPFAIDSTQITGFIDVPLPESCDDTWLTNLFNAWLLQVWSMFILPLSFFLWFWGYPAFYQDVLAPWIFAGMPVSSNKVFNA